MMIPTTFDVQEGKKEQNIGRKDQSGVFTGMSLSEYLQYQKKLASRNKNE